MDAKQLAALLTGREYLCEITDEESAQAKAAGLVVIFGASDDLMELDGAIRDEAYCYDGGAILLDAKGLLPSWDHSSESEESAQRYFERKPKARTIEALWAKEPGYSWTYRTDIPHETFEIVEDGEPYCRGIVFALADISGSAGLPPSASITLTDDPATGEVTVTADFGERVIPESLAHQMVNTLLQSILGSAKSYQQLEDTAPELNAEPSRIITPE